MRGKSVLVNCKHCKSEFEARVADVKRGWGKFCSKSCKAKRQEKQTGQMAEYLMRSRHKGHDIEDTFHPHDPYCLGQDY